MVCQAHAHWVILAPQRLISLMEAARKRRATILAVDFRRAVQYSNVSNVNISPLLDHDRICIVAFTAAWRYDIEASGGYKQIGAACGQRVASFAGCSLLCIRQRLANHIDHNVKDSFFYCISVASPMPMPEQQADGVLSNDRSQQLLNNPTARRDCNEYKFMRRRFLGRRRRLDNT